MKHKSSVYRSKAVACEQDAKAATNQTIQKEWEELAAQWHLMAQVAAQLSRRFPENDVIVG